MGRSSFQIDQKAFKRSLASAMDRAEAHSKREVAKLALEVKRVAERRSPVEDGELLASWYVQPGSDERGFYVDVGNRKSYAWIVEHGSVPHIIRVKKASVLYNAKTGQAFGQQVNHPGTAPHPMLRYALLQARYWRPAEMRA